ncbi:MAG: hypothetical protein WCL29_04590, partial [Pseudomonadota bacterium]
MTIKQSISMFFFAFCNQRNATADGRSHCSATALKHSEQRVFDAGIDMEPGATIPRQKHFFAYLLAASLLAGNCLNDVVHGVYAATEASATKSISVAVAANRAQDLIDREFLAAREAFERHDITALGRAR